MKKEDPVADFFAWSWSLRAFWWFLVGTFVWLALWTVIEWIDSGVDLINIDRHTPIHWGFLLGFFLAAVDLWQKSREP